MKYKITRNNTFNNKIVFCDGHPHSGKSMISKILEGFEGVEKTKEDESFVITQELYESGNIDRNTAKVLFRMWADRYLYNQMIGRNINMRPSDVTSLYKYPYPDKYIGRMCGGERQEITEVIKKNKPIFQNMSHNAIIYSDLYFDAFGDRLNILYIKRDIHKTVDSIMRVGFGERIGTDPTDVGTSVYHTDDISVPLYARDWPKEYIEMTPRQRVYRWIEQETKLVEESYNKSKHKDKILIIYFEDIVRNPYPILEEIEKLIDRKQNSRMAEILARERCPR